MFKSQWAIFIQDSWKVTRKLTLDLGIRYDYETLLAEEHGRMQDAAFNTPNSAIGGRIGQAQFDQWRAHFGQTAAGSGSGALASGEVPEPATWSLMILAAVGAWAGRRRTSVA